MSITRNRELSQFGSFIHIDDSTQSIGITTEATPFVGIGTTNPTVKLEVIGDTNIVGTLDASSFTLNGSPLVDAAVERWTFATNNVDIYRINGSVGIGTSTLTEKLTVDGNISAGQFISTVTSGTAPLVVLSDTEVTNLNASLLRGKVPPNGTIVGTADTQTLSNKTLTSPDISSPNIISGGVIFYGVTSGTTILEASSIASGTLTLPTVNDTLVGKATTDTFTNKIIDAGSNTITGISSSNLSISAGILNTQLENSTISGVSLGSTLGSLSFGTYLNSSGPYDGSTAISVSVAATSINTANSLVSRDTSGDFTAGTISVTNLTATQTVTALDFNSTSDIRFKENIQTIENSLDIVSSLRGVSFDWKETGKGSYGVIAQELEEVLPDLVKDGDTKSVNYNGLIGVLIESIKELKQEIEDLKNNNK